MQKTDAEINKLIEDNERLVYSIIKKNFSNYMHDEDIVQIGMIGLWKAVKNYQDGAKTFSAYAYICIVRSILAELYRRRKPSAIQTVPLYDIPYNDFEDNQLSDEYVDEVLAKVKANNERNYYILVGRMEGKTLEELAQEYNLSRERIRQICLKAKRYL